MSWRGREVRLAARPDGMPRESDFEVAEVEVPEPADGELVVRNAYVSVDPYMRQLMGGPRAFRAPWELGKPMGGGAVGEVIASRHPEYAVGDWVVHQLGWRELSVSSGAGLIRVDPQLAPVSTALGVLGMPGFTAWYGTCVLAEPKAGETVFVSAAAGAVGSVVGQLAKLAGSRVIGSAGSAAKLAWLRELGFDEAFDYRETPLPEALRTLAPDGVQLCFDNVGGEQLEGAIEAMARNGRIIACGAVSTYNDVERAPGPRNLHLLFVKELTIRGFRYSTHMDRYGQFLGEMGRWVREGRVRYRETVARGIENAPAAFIGLLRGENIGKMVVEVGGTT